MLPPTPEARAKPITASSAPHWTGSARVVASRRRGEAFLGGQGDPFDTRERVHPSSPSVRLNKTLRRGVKQPKRGETKRDLQQNQDSFDLFHAFVSFCGATSSGSSMFNGSNCHGHGRMARPSVELTPDPSPKSRGLQDTSSVGSARLGSVGSRFGFCRSVARGKRKRMAFRDPETSQTRSRALSVRHQRLLFEGSLCTSKQTSWKAPNSARATQQDEAGRRRDFELGHRRRALTARKGR